MKIKQTMLLAAALLAALAGNAGAEPVEHKVNVEVRVPNDVFYVVPVGGWTGTAQPLQWDIAGRRLLQLRQWLQMRSTLGAITVKVDGETVLARDEQKIPLRIRLDSGQRRCEVFRNENGSSPDCLVLSAAEAASDRRVSLDIVPSAPAGGYQPGVYHGVINLLFESAL